MTEMIILKQLGQGANHINQCYIRSNHCFQSHREQATLCVDATDAAAAVAAGICGDKEIHG